MQTIDKATYETERAICDKAQAYADAIMRGRKGNYLTAEEAAQPDYAACDNAMRGRVEQYELIHRTPEKFVAYLGEGKRNGMGCDRLVGQSYPVTTWTGDQIGNATIGSSWRVNSYVGTHMHQIYARVAGREFTGRGFGVGMAVVLRETAASKRAKS